jgi:lysylphosphatidylglycerol synthetase-like protein (DUF2156 family)
MTVRRRLLLALGLSLLALAALALGLPEYLSGVRQAIRSPGVHPVPFPPVFVLGSLAGLAALVVVLREQWRRQEYAWMAVSVLLSHVGVLAYVCRTLLAVRSGERAADA